jgi:hypothetical protein
MIYNYLEIKINGFGTVHYFFELISQIRDIQLENNRN